jgi:hypothetical protein
MLFHTDGQSAPSDAEHFDLAPPIRPKRSFYLEERALTAKQARQRAEKELAESAVSGQRDLGFCLSFISLDATGAADGAHN